MKQPYKTDIAVLMLFFNRPDHFEQVFNEVRKARPSRLFLYQDGPRGERDMPGIEACRQIVSDENIDWECEVHRHYCEQNQGCDPSGYLSQKWAFSMADKCMVLEDDVVPAQSFFPFCKEMLDRYEHDNRITMVAGFNVEEQSTDVPDDYFFTSAFSIWGWASWKRVVDQWDGSYGFMDDDYNMRLLDRVVKERRYRSDFMKMLHDHRANGKPYFESVFWSVQLLNSGLAIMPRQNQINNLGLSEDSTHFSGSMKTTPRAYRRIFQMKRYEMAFPLKHPKYVIENMAYKDFLYKTNAWGHPGIKVARSMEELALNLRYGNFGAITKALRRRVNKWIGRDRHV
ncbi:MAG: hemolysin activation protein [Prevotella sp.]|nr:hemolysin activation protein [Prevotella sp.]